MSPERKGRAMEITTADINAYWQTMTATDMHATCAHADGQCVQLPAMDSRSVVRAPEGTRPDYV